MFYDYANTKYLTPSLFIDQNSNSDIPYYPGVLTFSKVLNVTKNGLYSFSWNFADEFLVEMSCGSYFRSYYLTDMNTGNYWFYLDIPLSIGDSINFTISSLNTNPVSIVEGYELYTPYK